MATQKYNDGSTADSGTAASQGAQNRDKWYDRKGIEAANRVNIYQQFADARTMPTGWGKTFTVSKFLHTYDREETTSSGDFQKFGYLSNRKVGDLTRDALSEGAASGNEKAVKKITLETKLANYGASVVYTDDVLKFSEDDMQVRYRRELGEDANSLMEDLIQKDMLDSTTIIYGGTGTSKATVGPEASKYKDATGGLVGTVTYDLVRSWSRKLKRNRASTTTKLVTGSNKVDTKTVPAAYYAIVGPEIVKDLEVMTNGLAGNALRTVWVPAVQYGDAASLAEGEVGSIHNMRFIESEGAVVDRHAGTIIGDGSGGQYADALVQGSQKSSDSNKYYTDLHPVIIPTPGSFSTVGLKGTDKIQFTVAKPGDVNISNRFGKLGSFAYNFWYGGLITNVPGLLVSWVAVTK